MNKYRGANLVEYIVPIAVVAIGVGILLFTIFSDGSLLGFSAKSGKMTINKNKHLAVIDKNPPQTPILNNTAGTLGGSLDNPQSSCNKGNCSIDYGDFILNNVPEEFNSFVQTSGTAGAIDRLSSYFNQISSQLKDGGAFDLANEMLELSIMGHNIALVLKEFENIYNSCAGDSNCIASYNDLPFPKPASFDESVGAFPSGVTYRDMLDSGALGAAVNNNNLSPLANSFNSQLNKIMNNSSVPDETKGVIQELSWNIGTIGQDFNSNFSQFAGLSTNYYDPISGQLSTPSNVFNNSTDYFSNYQASNITHFNSSMICSVSYAGGLTSNCH